jgi:hypothetical protein
VGEREVEVERAAHQEERRDPRLVELCVLLLSSGPFYIMGRGWPYPSTKAPRAAPRGEAAARPGLAGPTHPNPNPSRSARAHRALGAPFPYPIRGAHMALMGFPLGGDH